MPVESFRIISLNCRGIRDKQKRQNLFFWLKSNNYHIILLQETFWTNDIKNDIEKEWCGKIILNPGTSHSKGTAILLNNNIIDNNFDLDIKNIHLSEDGRIVLLNLSIESKEISLINIYAPNNPKERKSFFDKIGRWISKFSTNNETIIGGDFNLAEAQNDRFKINPQDLQSDVSISSYKNLMKNYNLKDVWREMHPDKIQYTFREISRLDKFLVSDCLINFVQSSNILHSGIKSDHKCIKILLNFTEQKRGPGRWKLNTSILNDKVYKENIKSIIETVKKEYTFLPDQLLWEITKIKIKEQTIEYCTKKNKLKKNILNDLEQKIDKKEQELINSNYNYRIMRERDELVNNLHSMIEIQNRGAQIRSRAKWIEDGEKCTKYFFSLERKHNMNNTIKQLKRQDGTITSTNAEILEEQYNFYEKLYTKDNISKECIKNYLKNTKNHTCLKDEDKDSLEGCLKDWECKNAILSMKLNKSPGSDGLPAEFYIAFWDDIKTIVINSLNAAYHKGELSPTQRKGILTLLYKKGDKDALTNWRPISLLNTDYKILAHVLANRLKKVINNIISTDQSGYLKGRNIGFNIRLIQDVIDYCESNEHEGAILFLDFQKAFDTVNHDFLNQVLKKYNFGNSFIKWVDIMYYNAEAHVTNNGWTSKSFKISKGIRQGCPLSALLFLLVVEVLACNIRENSDDGLHINVNGKIKTISISQLADDTTLFLKDEQAIKNCLEKVELFGNASGLKLNKQKTEGLWLGHHVNRNDSFADINWNKTCIKALGVYFAYDSKEAEIKIWNDKLNSIKKILHIWNQRDLSLQGRILIIKSLALAKIVYLLSAIGIPEKMIKEINKEFFSFLWKKRRDKIARTVQISPIENGGLNMIDLKSYCTAMKAIWAYRLYKATNETWSIIPQKYFENCNIKLVLCMNTEKEKHIPIKLPLFYKNVITSWHECGGGKKSPQSAADIRKEIIWGNKYIQTKGKTIYFKHWNNSNINFIDDLIDKEGNFLKGEKILEKLKVTSNWIGEYHKIVKSIPNN